MARVNGLRLVQIALFNEKHGFTRASRRPGFEALTFVYTIFLLHGTKRNKILLLNFAALIAMFALGTIVCLLFEL